MDIVLHIGAHRCGSTAVEQVISQNMDVLGAEGVEIWPPSTLRAIPGFTGIAGAARAPGRKHEVLLAAAEAIAERLELSRAAGTQTLIWSEENLIGGMYENLTDRSFYKNCRVRLEAYAAFLPAPPRRVAFAIRSYTSYWSSAYLYLLAQRPLPVFSRLADGFADTARGWRDLAADIRAVFPASEIVAWQQEHLRGREIDCACAMAGRDGTQGLTAPKSAVNATRLTADEMAAMHRMHREMADETGRARRHALQADRAARPGPAPTMFTSDQTGMMAERYERDVAAFENGYCELRMIAPLAAEAQL